MTSLRRGQRSEPTGSPNRIRLTPPQNNVALLGDACHPTLPYQGQGSAMAVEDGAVLGRILGLLSQSAEIFGRPVDHMNEALKLYETIRKARTTLNVQGAAHNRYWYHLHDGSAQQERDQAFAEGRNTVNWTYLDPEYHRQVLGFDAVANAEILFQAWLESKRATLNGTEH